MVIKIPETHPRYKSLLYREKIVEGYHEGYVVLQGLIAHGRGECFDYILGEETIEEAYEAEKAAVAKLLLSRHPVISVNGNVAALVPGEVVRLAELTGAKIEVNLFYRTREREEKIADILRRHGAREVLGVGEDADRTIEELGSERRRVSSRGIYIADTVLIPLEDGDRAEALKRLGKFIIAIDLNPLSRTAQVADITIVDNIVRALPNMIKLAEEYINLDRTSLENIVSSYDNKAILSRVLRYIRDRLGELAGE